MTHGKDDDAMLERAMKDPSFEAFEEQDLFSQVLSTFKGRNWWASVITLIVGTVFNVIFFVGLYKFLTNESLDARVYWGVIMLLMAVFIVILKVWTYVQMSRNTLLRELKRVELQVARLSEELENRSGQ